MRELEQWVSEWCRAGEGLKRAASFGVGIDRQHRKWSRCSTRTSTTWSGHPLGLEPPTTCCKGAPSAYCAWELPITPRYPDGWKPPLIAPNVPCWTTGISESVNCVFGGLQGLINEHFRPASNTSRQAYSSAFLQGLASGAKGPAAAIHCAP